MIDATLFAHIPALSGAPAPKIEYEYQAVALDCEAYFGKDKRIWIQFHKKGVTENLIRYALKECQSRNKPHIGYFIKIINNKLRA